MKTLPLLAVCLEKTLFFFSQLRLEPSVVSYNATMSSCEKADQWQLAVILFEMMPLKRLQPDSISFSAVFFQLGFGGRNPFSYPWLLPFAFTIFRDFLGDKFLSFEAVYQTFMTVFLLRY